jgi:hypothetical protein
MDALIIPTTLAALRERGCCVDGPQGEPLSDEDVFALRIVRTLETEASGPHAVAVYRYDLQSADERGRWHSIALNNAWLPALRNLCEGEMDE